MLAHSQVEHNGNFGPVIEKNYFETRDAVLPNTIILSANSPKGGGFVDIDDENVCSDLGFDYLQGYKYSKPVAIEELGQFLEKI